MVTFRQLEICLGSLWRRSKAARSGAQCLDMSQGSCQHLLCKESHWTINEGEVKLLDMGIKPIISRTRDGKKIRGDRAHAGNLMPLLEQLQAYKVTAYNTRHQRGRKLSVGGVITPILCAAGVQLDKRRSTPPGWMDIKFCKTNLSLSTRSWMGDSNSNSPTHGWTLQASLPNPELTTVLGGTNIDFRPPVYTWLGMKQICKKKRSSSIELRIELRLKLKMECRKALIG
ncbi:unnamed protein product [Microthlaspi erraticum]|uniref:Arabidopsis retrotransposon Orf1 C-terminal domain-containing protein n=1 Tax=Microthlaspi erraticum TaxID=1685480 RepID=A0A6D2KVE8_9BRAS|nr:unnamed protein product [Microthlaspi erraticum]